MNRLWAPLLLFLLPAGASAQANIPLFDPNWSLVPKACQACPCGMGGVLQFIQNGMNATISFGILICVLVIVFAGILWILTPTNPENHSQAKKVLTNAVIGFLIILSAWLIVDFVMKLLYDGDTTFGPWNEILAGGDVCVVAKENTPLFSGSITAKPGIGLEPDGGGGSGGGGTGGGQCVARDTGGCSIRNLGIFGPAALTASKVCDGESKGNAGLPSTVDKLGDGTPYSFGLFQINITAHQINGLNCPNAFSKKSCTVSSCGPGTGVRVTNPALYNQCKAAATNPQINIRTAHRIYTQAGSRWSPWGAAKACGLADSTQSSPYAFAIIGL
jgi:hypothetical protein